MNLPLQLDRNAPVALQDQLFEQLRQLIIGGRLKPNTRVIATRFLAEQAGVSRTTVLLAYERLISEGYLETRPAIGTFVSATLPDQPKLESARAAVPEIRRHAALHPAVLAGLAMPADAVAGGAIDFDPSGCDGSNLLPVKVWLKLVRNALELEPDGLAKPPHPAGVPALRRAIADRLAATRGIMASPDQVIIVSGRRQAAGFVAHLFQRPGARIVVEASCEPELADLFKARRAELVRVPGDESGLDTAQLPDGPVPLMYVTPARPNPLGGTLSQTRRTAVVEWARTAGAYVIEDDRDSELRYVGTIPQPLAAIDPYGLVFYTGSFAQTLGAGLGLGYVVAPPEFVDDLLAIKHIAEANCPWLEQMVTADLIRSGEYDHHLRRIRKLYMERRDCLVQALKTQFGDIALKGSESGTRLIWLLPEAMPSAEAIRELASACGVVVHAAVDRSVGALVFGFAGLTPAQLREGISRLGKALCS